MSVCRMIHTPLPNHMVYAHIPAVRVWHFCLIPQSSPINLVARQFREMDILPSWAGLQTSERHSPSLSLSYQAPCSPTRRRFRSKCWNGLPIGCPGIPNENTCRPPTTRRWVQR